MHTFDNGSSNVAGLMPDDAALLHSIPQENDESIHDAYHRH